jgi:tetratricopeptide (TPR) repeat protein
MKKVFFIVFLLALIACHHQKKIDEKALALNKKATDTFLRNFENADSLHLALSIIDSAINIEPKYVNFYNMKISILSELNKYDQIISVYDKILQLRKNNYFFLLGKGIAFEHLNNLDSANYYYHLALDHFEDMKWKTGADKNAEKVILYGILKDTVNFNIQLDLYKKKYSNEKGFDLMYENLKTFDRNEIINGKGDTTESYINKAEENYQTMKSATQQTML